MKKITFLIYGCLAAALSVSASPNDTLINGIPVNFTYTSSPFPPDWQEAPISAKAAPMSSAEARRTAAVLVTAMNKYPATMLKANLKAVYFFKSMSFYNVGYGGTNSTDILYLTNDGEEYGYTDTYLEQTFHHEFSSILFRNFPKYLDTTAWQKANAPGFIYNDPEAGVGAIRNGQSSQDPDSLLCMKGLLTQYAGSGIENDINTIAQNLFRPDPRFWRYVKKYPRIRIKTKLLISFYHQYDPQFTEAYFRKFATKS